MGFFPNELHATIKVITVKDIYKMNVLNYTGSRLWNSLNLNLQNSSSLYTFKKAVRQQIMTSYLQ